VFIPLADDVQDLDEKEWEIERINARSELPCRCASTMAWVQQDDMFHAVQLVKHYDDANPRPKLQFEWKSKYAYHGLPLE